MCIAYPPIGFIGLGIMGLPMARHLRGDHYPVTVFNRTRSRAETAKDFGASIAGSPRELADRSEIVITMLTNPEAIRAVTDGPDGLFAHSRKQLTWIQMSTIDVQSTLSFARDAQARRITFVDCPVTGSKGPAENRQLILLAGGSAEALAYVDPVLRCFGQTIVKAGDVGAGTALKLCMNLIVAQ
ncbi:MAG TPA: NAD(P)-dependent oxidoreductase, partial [Elusimicrobiota bacterium]|nr:NAD(P)-dependent oxidoreductase [Elusimicrobiota bacterium]